MKIVYSPLAQQDILEIREYVGKKLKNKSAAQRLVEEIAKGCSLLKGQPMLGMSLKERMDLQLDMRCLVVGNYLVFYKSEMRAIKIIRVLDSRTDYVVKLLSCQEFRT